MTAETRIVGCLACATLNRVPVAKLGAGANCGRCGLALFQGRPVELTPANFAAHAIKSDLPFVIDFWAPWCGPCRQMAPAFQAAAAQLEPQIRLGKVNTEVEQELASRFAIQSIPTLVALSRGRELARQTGAMPPGAIVQWARKFAA